MQTSMCHGTGDVPDRFKDSADDEGDAEVGFTTDEEVGVISCQREEEEEEDDGGWDGWGVVPHFVAGPGIVLRCCIRLAYVNEESHIDGVEVVVVGRRVKWVAGSCANSA